MKILSSIILIAAAANAATSLAPRGKTRRAVVFAVALATLLACLTPIFSALDELPDATASLAFDFGETAESDPSDCVARTAEQALSSEIRRRFGATPREVEIRLPKETGDPGLIRVALDRRDAGIKGKISAWLAGESDAPVEIRIEGGDGG